MKQKIDIIINKEGNIEVSVNGVKGKGCKELTNQIEKALGQVQIDKLTKEYYEKQQKNKLYN